MENTHLKKLERSYKNKGLTMIDLSYMIWDMKTEERRNRFTGAREFLTVEEADLQRALDKFSRLNPKAYMTLLD
jgi:hypothetical protein